VLLTGSIQAEAAGPMMTHGSSDKESNDLRVNEMMMTKLPVETTVHRILANISIQKMLWGCDISADVSFSSFDG
jgi:hypothetical protein